MSDVPTILSPRAMVFVTFFVSAFALVGFVTVAL